jgi:hypothetical protein
MFASFDSRRAGLRLNHNVDVDEAHERASEIRLRFAPLSVTPAGRGTSSRVKQNALATTAQNFEARRPSKLWFEIVRGLGPGIKCSPHTGRPVTELRM